jgi:hypothetical protein
VLGRFGHVASIMVNANHSIMRTAVKLRVVDCVANCVWLAIPQCNLTLALQTLQRASNRRNRRELLLSPRTVAVNRHRVSGSRNRCEPIARLRDSGGSPHSVAYLLYGPFCRLLCCRLNHVFARDAARVALEMGNSPQMLFLGSTGLSSLGDIHSDRLESRSHKS